MPVGRSNAGAHMTLEMDCWPDELSDAQLAAYQLAESEHKRIRSRLTEIVGDAGAESLFLGEIFSAYELCGAPAAELQAISKPLAAARKEHRELQAISGRQPAAQQQQTPRGQKRTALQSAATDNYVEAIDDDDDDDDNHDDVSYSPVGQKRPSKVAKLAAEKKRDAERSVATAAAATVAAVRSGVTRGAKGFVANAGVQRISSSAADAVRPSENTSIGGLSVGDTTRNRKDVVDLTRDESITGGAAAAALLAGKGGADSREVTFSKLQGKTFPSLVVVARPSLRVKELANDRPALDAKVKSVLMHTATKYCEWLIQQGLVRSEQSCQVHAGKVLKLGMYSDASKFSYSGGYLWISECCPSRYVSVFNGSLFEGAPHAPAVLLKLIYHWSCQTNVQNVVQWVKVDNLYVKGLYTLLRAVCTVALHQHGGLLGGPGKRVEVGVISLGTTSQDGQQRQVKVEVLGVLDFDGKVVRLRAVEPLTDGERNYKKRFAKILEPLIGWVHKDSIIQTDLTVDKGTMHTMGFRHVQQTAAAEAKTKGCNANIMDYLRRIVPRMFQNTLSLLSRQIIQQFLDELVWREWYGTTPAVAFDNIVRHIAEQTRLEAKEPLVGRLAKVSQNPFRNWAHLAVKTPAKALRDNFFAGASTSAPTVAQSPSNNTPGKRGRKRREPSPEPTPPPPTVHKKVTIKEEPRSTAAQRKADAAAAAAAAQAKANLAKAAAAQKAAAAIEEKTVHLEAYYYATINAGAEPNDSGKPVVGAFRAQCPQCHATCHSNIELMDHLKLHVPAKTSDSVPAGEAEQPNGASQCRYCLHTAETEQEIECHQHNAHPLKTRSERSIGFACLICECRLSTTNVLAAHMQRAHVTCDVPYRCGCCAFGTSSLRTIVDHFYAEHANSAALQCPFCMQVFVVQDSRGNALPANVDAYLRHLREHVHATLTAPSVKCNRCTLTFVDRGAGKLHQSGAHVGQSKAAATPMLRNATKIAKPKYRYNYVTSNVSLVSRYEGVTLAVENGHLCLECDADFEEKGHFPGLMKCPRCPYHSSCQRTMIAHSTQCLADSAQTADGASAASNQLPIEYHCVCGFASTGGNEVARHLLSCGRRSAYASVEAAQENTVKRNVLDMLGLVRRDGDADAEEGATANDTEEGATANDADENDESMTETLATSEATPTSEMAIETLIDTDSADTAGQPMEQDDAEMSEVVVVPAASEVASAAGGGDDVGHQHQFNTDLSLDDLAAPASVAPPPPTTEQDRTPQLSDEYQSLATPRVAHPVEHGGAGSGETM